MDQYKLDELIGRPFDTAMAMARMILSGLLDRFPRLKIVVAHMGGGLLPCMGRLDFGWRLGCDGMPERAVIRCKKLPSEYLALFSVDTMGFWAPHVREAVEVFGADRVMFGTDYGPVPIDPNEHVDIVNALAISHADKEKILWRNAASFSISTSRRRPHRASIHRHVGELDHRRPLLDLAGSMADTSAGVLSAAGMPCCVSLVRTASFVSAARHRAVEPVDDLGRRLGRSEQRRPGIGLDAGDAAFRECRHVRKLGRHALRARPRARAACRTRSADRSGPATSRCSCRCGRRAAR